MANPSFSAKHLTLGVLSLILLACAATNEAGNKLYDSKQFAKKADNRNTVILDVRTPEEYQGGHIKNAVLMDFNGGVFDTAFTKLDQSKTYLVYCKSGKRSDKAATKMKEAGFSKVYQLKGGITSWTGETVKQ